MTWRPIVVGVDASLEGAWAATAGAALARTAGTTCHLVHATREGVPAVALAELTEQAGELVAAHIAAVHDRVASRMWGVVPETAIDQLKVRIGRPARVLKDVVHETGAELVVLGGKHHSTLGRWMAGSTALDVVRSLDVPVLVTMSARTPVRRVLAAVDVSGAARPTIAAAERFAETVGAQLRIISVLEPLPVLPDAPSYPTGEFFNMLEERVTSQVWPLVKGRDTEKFVRYGPPVDLIAAEAAEWEADLVVVGSHGKGLIDRLLIGSVTERLLNQLPTSLLVLPAHSNVEARAAATATTMSTPQLVG